MATVPYTGPRRSASTITIAVFFIFSGITVPFTVTHPFFGNALSVVTEEVTLRSIPSTTLVFGAEFFVSSIRAIIKTVTQLAFR